MTKAQICQKVQSALPDMTRSARARLNDCALAQSCLMRDEQHAVHPTPACEHWLGQTSIVARIADCCSAPSRLLTAGERVEQTNRLLRRGLRQKIQTDRDVNAEFAEDDAVLADPAKCVVMAEPPAGGLVPAANGQPAAGVVLAPSALARSTPALRAQPWAQLLRRRCPARYARRARVRCARFPAAQW